MKDRPILFSAPMVRALLAGTKTQTRRVVKITHRTPGLAACLEPADPAWTRPSVAAELCPYGVTGDRLWVRETWRYRGIGECWSGTVRAGFVYRATENVDGIGEPWRSSRYMPRFASRIRLEVTGVRVERLQDVSQDDCYAEGVEPPRCPKCGCTRRDCVAHFDHGLCGLPTPCHEVFAYRALWESINGAGSWDANPWVWVIGFKVVS